MNRYFGELSTDAYGMNVDECKVAHIALTKEQACASDADGLLDGTALGEAVTTVTEFVNPMPYARNVTIVASATQTGKATVYGTNIANQPISEELTINSDTPVVGAKAFKTVTSVVLPIKAGTETIDLGWGEKIGLPYIMDVKPLAFAMQGGAIETTAPTLTIDSDELEKNVIDLNSNLDSTKAVDIYLFM
jgi:hypothetical protein